jgi:hypothetical protein
MHDYYFVYRLYGRKPVRDDQRRPVVHEALDRVAYQYLCLGVYRACRFVQNQYSRVEGKRPSKTYELFLADGKPRPALAQLGRVAFGQPAYKGVGVNFARGRRYPFVADLFIAEPDVARYVARKKEYILKDYREIRAQLPRSISRISAPSSSICPRCIS